MVHYHQPTTDKQSSAPVGAPGMHAAIESHLRHAGRLLEVAGVVDPEAARLAKIVFRLAQRIAVDAGRLAAA
jgi:hypothetical protein